MTLVWKPGIWDDVATTLYELPLPVNPFSEALSYDATVQKVPGADGAIATAKTEGPTTLRITGLISRRGSGALITTEQGIMDEIDLFRAAANGASTTRVFFLMSHYDAGTAQYRYRIECIAQSLNFGSLDRASLLHIPYEFVVLALDPELRTSATGNLST